MSVLPLAKTEYITNGASFYVSFKPEAGNAGLN
jgi:hypothetical protein